ncbi:hypothetical protein KSC_002320 [Ktedonobacter sp. SOSP1-52]|uniref:helicase C-terminal domain-containing protein n=1 Tax=Ktedonobacter sp. SOSP1-52 TaxID=2778366 RepID=UPI0019164A0D|nr:helicase C-terminal domain-containing protein [Ktedonobacter sp. SOSP1-52]GHO61340.1 hypothetical protein KSC_002320 [Ktedonobacter sp. SOSP1-52]
MGNKFEALKEYALSQGWDFVEGKSIPYGEQIIIRSHPSYHAVVDFYPKNGRMVIGGPVSPLKMSLTTWYRERVTAELAQKKLLANNDVASNEGSPTISDVQLGIDESGKGDWFGPLVVAAVLVTKENQMLLYNLGVRDSKKLSLPRILELDEKIRQLIPEKQYFVNVLSPELYNTQYENFRNVNVLLADLYAQTAKQVWQASPASVIMCNQFSQKTDRLENAFAQQGLPKPAQFQEAGETSIAVAAASILANAAFMRALQDYGFAVGIEEGLPRGASDIVKLRSVASHILQKYGLSTLRMHAKMHFAPIQDIVKGNVTLPNTTLTSPAEIVTTADSVDLSLPAWRLDYHPSGFYRFTFIDGGILDWNAYSTGKLVVRGKLQTKSYKTFKEIADGIIYRSPNGNTGIPRSLESLKGRVSEVFPDFHIHISKVFGIGWRQKRGIGGERFDFTDGGVLWYYPSTGTLTIQGKPSDRANIALREIAEITWESIDSLLNTLKRVFPDWELGQHEESLFTTEAKHEDWVAVENALDWETYWPGSCERRLAANGKSPCQQEFIADWASILIHHQNYSHLFAQAPTGIGKTLSALIPALAWVAKAPHNRRIYYLVNRVAQHDNPIREIQKHLAPIFGQRTGQPLRVIDLVGRSQWCLFPESKQLTDVCKQSKIKATWEMLPSYHASWTEVEAHLKQKGRICPYHTLQELMPQAHIIICDYWWLFSQAAQGKALADRAGFSVQDSILIVDEAHNLPERIREEGRIDISVGKFEEVIRRVSNPLVSELLKRAFDRVKEAPFDKSMLPSQLLQACGGREMVQQALDFLDGEDAEAEGNSIPVPSRILRMLLQPDEKVVIYHAESSEDQKSRLVFRLVDVTNILQAGYSRVNASVSMSGTLAAPSDSAKELYYQLPLFGLPIKKTLPRVYASPFPLVHQRWIYSPNTVGSYKKRNEFLGGYAAHIKEIGQVTPGVTVVFFSSYEFLRQVRVLIEDKSEQELIVEERPPEREEAENAVPIEDQLRILVRKHDRAYLFAIYTGKVAEGTNFSGNLIKTVICVSLPFERMELYHQRLEALYSERFAVVAQELGGDVAKKASEYARERTALSLILQACGRGIRSESDRCVFVFLDRRYGASLPYNKLSLRRFLEPRPFNLHLPKETVKLFHSLSMGENTGSSGDEWDEALMTRYK